MAGEVTGRTARARRPAASAGPWAGAASPAVASRGRGFQGGRTDGARSKAMRLWKFTDENDQTRGGMQWGENVTHGPTSGEGNLCAPGWLHAYVDLRLGVMVSPVHLSFTAQHLWEAEGEVGKTDGLKVGGRTLTTFR